MLSYLSNRHYQTLTQLLPPELRVNQPQQVYFRTHAFLDTLNTPEDSRKLNIKAYGASSYKKVKAKKKMVSSEQEKQNGCPLCYESHIKVQYYGFKHICIKCRNLVRDEFGNQVRIFLDKKGEIVALGIIPKQLGNEFVQYYITDHTKLEVSDTGAYATFAGENELVVILKQKENPF